MNDNTAVRKRRFYIFHNETTGARQKRKWRRNEDENLNQNLPATPPLFVKLQHYIFSQREQTRPLPCSAGDQVFETMAPPGIVQHAVHSQFPLLKVHSPRLRKQSGLLNSYQPKFTRWRRSGV